MLQWRGQFDEAAKLFLESLQISQSRRAWNANEHVGLLRRLGNASRDRWDYGNAEKYFAQALVIAPKSDQDSQICLADDRAVLLQE